MVRALKRTHPKSVISKRYMCFEKDIRPFENGVSERPLKYSFFSKLKVFSIVMNKHHIRPQQTKVQLAPCQKPVKSQTIKRLMAVRLLDVLLPPRGI